MRDPDFNDKDLCVIGIMAAAAVCSIFWFAVGIGLGWYIAQ